MKKYLVLALALLLSACSTTNNMPMNHGFSAHQIAKNEANLSAGQNSSDSRIDSRQSQKSVNKWKCAHVNAAKYIANKKQMSKMTPINGSKNMAAPLSRRIGETIFVCEINEWENNQKIAMVKFTKPNKEQKIAMR